MEEFVNLLYILITVTSFNIKKNLQTHGHLKLYILFTLENSSILLI